MEAQTFSYDLRSQRWSGPFPELDSERTLVMAFGAPEARGRPQAFADLKAAFPRSVIVGCSTAGEIAGTEIRDGSISVTATKFALTPVKSVAIEVRTASQSRSAGRALARALASPDLRAIFVLSEGLSVNGSELASGLSEHLPKGVVVTGGLAGDGTRFGQTWVCVGDEVRSNIVAAVGLYGNHLLVGHGSKGGWDKFGPERTVTRSQGNVLYEIDGRPALSLYKEYLGPKASELPSSGLLFPLAMRSDSRDERVLVRTLLAVDEAAQSMTFAGDLPEGSLVQLMKADFDRLVDGAAGAAQMANFPEGERSDTLAIAVSCVGRRLVLGDRTEEEVEAVKDVLPSGAVITGFYSYGELSPSGVGLCDLHNQTMTLTTFAEELPTLSDEGVTETRELPFLVTSLSYDLATRRWSAPFPFGVDSPRTLVLAFGDPAIAGDPDPIRSLRHALPRAVLAACSGAGSIAGTEVRDGILSVCIARFSHTDLHLVSSAIEDPRLSYEVGCKLAQSLCDPQQAPERPIERLRAVFVLSDGLHVNGSELVRGLNETLPSGVVVTGGLAGDGTRFQKTWVAHGAEIGTHKVVAVGLYGNHLLVGHGSKGGWDKFGPERTVTRSQGNVLYEIDGRPALSLYKEYLGPKASELPSSGLLFPLAMRSDSRDERVLVRTLLAVDEAAQSMTFAGDLPEGSLVQLMKADFERLVDGAAGAAGAARALAPKADSQTLAIAVSCVGRRLVLGDRTEEEVEAVRDALPKDAVVAGFYSYGELSPSGVGLCDLHNQTMTLTTIAESPHAQALPRLPSPSAAPPRRTPEPRPPLDEPDSRPQGAGKAQQRLTSHAFTFDTAARRWSVPAPPRVDSPRTLVLAFGAPEIGAEPEPLIALSRAYPTSHVIGCSGSGEIAGTEVRDGILSVVVTRFAHTDLSTAIARVSASDGSYAAGRTLASELAAPDLRAVFVLSDGLLVNGSELARGLNDTLPTSVVVTGGLAGDGTRFQKTWVFAEGRVQSGIIAAVGLYGSHLLVGHGSKGGWDKFGPERTVTRSQGNVLYEIDGRPALSLYKEYLGPKASELPSSGLLFPLAMRSDSRDERVLVRTLLAVDEAAQSMTFAGDLPEGSLVQLMKADFERLVDGAAGAARSLAPKADSQTLAIAVSCVGRRLVLGDRTEEEVEAVRDALPKDAVVAGFYSYGELSPFATGRCDLHNQTMTLTTFAESDTPVASVLLTATPSEDRRNASPVRPAPPTLAPVTTESARVPRDTSPAPAPSRAPSRRPPPGPRLTIQRASAEQAASGLSVARQRIGAVELVTLSGRLSESFQGGDLGRSLSGVVVFDLAAVERITSFGVREWLQLLKEAELRCSAIYLARCSEPVVTQLGTIRGFAGKGAVVSMFAPYQCNACGTSLSALVDAEYDLEAIRDRQPPEVACPRCAAQAAFDDDPSSYFTVSGALAGVVSEEVRAAIAVSGQRGVADAVEKTVEGRTTTIRVRLPLDGSIRWRRIFDGLEGRVLLDLVPSSGGSRDGVLALRSALESLPSDVDSLEIEGCPSGLLAEIAEHKPPRIEIVTALLDANCLSCGTRRTALIDLRAVSGALLAGEEPAAPCRTCGQPLSLQTHLRPLRRLLESGRGKASTGVQTRSSAQARAIPPAPDLTDRDLRRSRPSRGIGGYLAVGLGSAGFAALAVTVVLLIAWAALVGPANEPIENPVAAPEQPQAADGWQTPDGLPPAWSERPVALDTAALVVVGQGKPAPSKEAALESARERAVAQMLAQVFSDLRGTPVHTFLTERGIEGNASSFGPSAVARYEAQLGAQAGLSRVAVAFRQGPDGVQAVAQYSVERSVYDKVVQSYSKTESFAGLTVAKLFPGLSDRIQTDGELVVLSVDRRPARGSGLVVGDVLLSIGGAPVATGQDAASVGGEAWEETKEGSSLVLEVESNGAARQVKLPKPAAGR